MEYKNLRKKTVFDFCKDAAVLKEVTGLSREEYEELFKDNPVERARGLMDFAERTKNKALEDAVRRDFKKELQEYDTLFNE